MNIKIDKSITIPVTALTPTPEPKPQVQTVPEPGHTTETPSMPQPMTSAEAAAYLRMSAQNLHRRAVKYPDPVDPIPTVLIGPRQRRYPQPELANWVKRQKKHRNQAHPGGKP